MQFLDCKKNTPAVCFEIFAKPGNRRKGWWLGSGFAAPESIPLPDESQDAVTSIFMFHELPPKVRRIVLSEFARVLKPGGRLVLVDSLQHGDEHAQPA